MVKRVIIVGGGYAGTSLSRALDEVAEVQLVDARDRFVHNVAAIRGVVDPSLLDRILIPYDRLLRRGSVRQSVVIGASSSGVTLVSSEHIEGDIVVLATGSHYASPFKPLGESTQVFADSLRTAHSDLMSAKAVAIVGGGAVGTELAGEISSAYPGKAVTLVSGSPSLMPGYSDRLAETLATQLRDKGVLLRFNHRVEGLAATDHPFTGSLGEGLGGAEQLVFPALGARPTTAVFRQMPGTSFDAQGRVVVDGWLRPAGFRNIFALGDAAATGDAMTIVAITRQVPWLAKTITALLAGQTIESLAPYKPWPTRGILVPLGPRDGASALPILRNGMLVGRWLTSRIKGRELFIPRYLKEFGYATGDQ
ncbi:NAD(P)/FAD-dependent oxidoreductase [Bradyrhizobium sp.]|jgi:NADH dehydrogenase FAD-containing subunit|uniref:NAD(P)/FAD-dependent oxidoreductase n=1 Tax=Bradyrhizobium sp. TaxID=376 RepID=UPI003D0E684E